MIQVEGIFSGGGVAPNLQSKSVTYTSNGTATITPDEGYDALKKVDVTVNVASGGRGRLEYLYLSDTSTGVELRNVSLFWCDFATGTYNFMESSNVTFEHCNFTNSEITCTQEIYDAIVNGNNNSYSTSNFNIV